MKTKLLCGALALLAGSLLADTTPGDDITNAVNSLAGAASYSWKTTVVVPEGTQYRPGPTTGKLEKEGYTDVTLSMRGNTLEFITKGGKTAVNTPDNGWQSPADMATDQGPGRFIGAMVRTFKAPTALALTLASSAQSLTNSDSAYSGDLTEAGAKTFLTMQRRGGGGAPPEVSNAKGSVKFWIKDGTLAKYEYKVTGTISFNGNDRAVDRDTTVEFSDVGATKVTVPDEAMKILSAAPAAPAPATDSMAK